jgi:hypothetical protein
MALQAMMLLIVAMTLLELWTGERHLQEKIKARDKNAIDTIAEDVKVVLQLCRCEGDFHNNEIQEACSTQHQSLYTRYYYKLRFTSTSSSKYLKYSGFKFGLLNYPINYNYI